MTSRLSSMALLGLALALLQPSSPSSAAVDAHVEVAFWDADLEAVRDEGPDTVQEAAEPELRVRVSFLEKWAVRGRYRSAEPEGDPLDVTLDSLSLEIQRKIVPRSERTWLALGAGWERVELDGGGSSGDLSGLRVSLDGRVGLAGFLQGYGEVGYFPSLGDAEAPLSASTEPTDLEDARGWELEAGLLFRPSAHVSLRLGYRFRTLHFDQSFRGVEIDTVELRSEGFLLAAGLRF